MRILFTFAACLVLCLTSGGQGVDGPRIQLLSCVSEAVAADLASGNFHSAAEASRSAIATDPLCPDTHYQLAYSLMRENLAKESLTEYTSAARLRTPGSDDLRYVALDYALLEDYPDAERWTRRALALAPNDPENWYVLGRIQYSAGGWHDALSSFTRVLALAPDSIKAENNLGLVYESLNNEDKAAEAYRKAIGMGEQSGKSSEQPFMNLAVLLSHKGNQDEALSLLLKAVQIAPEDADAREHLGQLYLELNQLPEAQAQLEKAVALQPRNSRLHFLLGQAYRRSGMSEKAKTELALAESLNGSHSTPDYFK